MTKPVQHPHWGNILLNGLCPRCGLGKIYQGFLTLKPACQSCGLDLKQHDSGDGPAYFVIFIMGFVTVLAAILVEIYIRPSMTFHMVVWPIFVLMGSLLLLRPMKTMMVFLQYKTRHSSDGS